MPSAARFRHLASLALAAALLNLGLVPNQAPGQQRNAGIEIYGLAGMYYFGNESNLLKARRWAPQFGASIFVPVFSKWGLLVDGIASRLEVEEGPFGPHDGHPHVFFYRARPDLAAEDVTTQQLFAIHPSFVRRWRMNRVSIYAGGGFASEHQRWTSRYRPINSFEDFKRESVIESGLPYVNAADFPEAGWTGIYARSAQFIESHDSVSATGLTARGGILVDATPRTIVRAGYSYIFTYLDSPPSQVLELGVGYRF